VYTITTIIQYMTNPSRHLTIETHTQTGSTSMIKSARLMDVLQHIEYTNEVLNNNFSNLPGNITTFKS